MKGLENIDFEEIKKHLKILMDKADLVVPNEKSNKSILPRVEISLGLPSNPDGFYIEHARFDDKDVEHKFSYSSVTPKQLYHTTLTSTTINIMES